MRMESTVLYFELAYICNASLAHPILVGQARQPFF